MGGPAVRKAGFSSLHSLHKGWERGTGGCTLCAIPRALPPPRALLLWSQESWALNTASAALGFLLMDFEDKMSLAALESTPGVLVICTSPAQIPFSGPTY